MTANIAKSSMLVCIQFFENIFNIINHILIGFVSLYLTWLCWTLGNSMITRHVLLTTLGYQLLMAEAIMTFYSENSWTRITKRETKIWLHIVLQVVGSALAIYGIAIYIESKEIWHDKHFVSMHAKTGLVSLIFLIISLLNGICAFFAQRMKMVVKPVFNKLFHNLMGLTAFVVGMVSLYYGYETDYMKRTADAILTNWLKCFGIATVVLTLISPFKTMYTHVRGLLY